MNGLVDADYGASLFKKRIATKHRGKRGSVRTLLACKRDRRAVFLYRFEKNERDNVTEKERAAYKLLARGALDLSENAIHDRLYDQSLVEVHDEQED